MRVRSLTASALVLSLGVSGCGNTGNIGNICERPLICVGGAIAILAAVVLIASSGDDDDSSSDYNSSLSMTSDPRLKRDMHQVGVLENGVKLYSFRYWNDKRSFIGVNAEELLQDPRFRDAVSVSDKGYYLVNYRALGARLVGDVAQYEEASRHALEAAKPAL
jgi:hypothetical protein